MATLPYRRRIDRQGYETFLTPSADNKTRNYDTELPNQHSSVSTKRPN